jgi:hypothetical protein
MSIKTISRPPTPTKLVLTTMLAAPGTWVKLNKGHPLVGKYGPVKLPEPALGRGRLASSQTGWETIG